MNRQSHITTAPALRPFAQTGGRLARALLPAALLLSCL
jgi:hypothetical protein